MTGEIIAFDFDVVSIQLVSPASGESINYIDWRHDHYCFNSISFPSEWGENAGEKILIRIPKFPFN